MATTTDTLIFELKVKDDASKGFDAWDKRLKAISKTIEKFAKDFKGLDKVVLAFSKAAARHSGDMAKIWVQNFGKIGQESIKALTKLSSEGIKSLTKLITVGGKLFKSFATTITSSIIPGFKLLGKAISALLSPIKAVAEALGSMFIKATEQISEFVSNSVRAFSKFEDQLIVARRTMGLTAEATTELGEELQNLSVTALKGGVASEELARIAGIAGTLGIEGKADILAFTETIAKMAVATNLTAEAAATALPKILNAWKLPIAENIEALGSVINILGNNFNATQSEITDGMLRMKQSAEAFGLTIDQTAALATAIIDSGLRVRTGTTAMSAIMKKLTAEHTKFAEVLGINSASLKEAILSNDPTAALQMIFEAFNKIATATPDGKIQASQALKDLGLTGQGVTETFLAMSGNLDTLSEALKTASQEMVDQKSLSEEFDVAMSTLTKAWESFKNIVDIVLQLIGKPLAEALATILSTDLVPLLTQFYEWVTTNETVLATWDAIVTAIQTGISAVIQTAVAWKDQLLSNEEVLKSIESIWISLTDIVNVAIGALTSWFSTLFSDMTKAGVEMSLVEKALIGIDRALSMFLFEVETAGAWEAFKNLAVKAWDAIKNAAANVWKFIIDQIGSVDKDTAQWLKNIKEIVSVFSSLNLGDFVDVIKAVLQYFADWVTGVKILVSEWENLIAFKDKYMAKIKSIDDAIANFGKAVINVFTGMGKAIQSVIGYVGNLISNIWEATKALVGLGEESHGNSVYPDMSDAIQSTTQTQKILTQSIGESTGQIRQLGTASEASLGALDTELAAINQQLESQRQLRGASMASARLATMGFGNEGELQARAFQLQIDKFKAQQQQTTATQPQAARASLGQAEQQTTAAGTMTPQPMTLQANLILDDMVIGKMTKRFTQEQQTQANRITSTR